MSRIRGFLREYPIYRIFSPTRNPEEPKSVSNYRRWYVSGGTYFFTVVTHQRRPFLTTDLARQCLRDAITTIRRDYPFEAVATVLLPDHLHTIWTLPDGEDNFSLRWSRIKETFTGSYLAGGGKEGPVSASRKRKGERGIWQRRFWEHCCKDEDDLKRLLDYLHWNPVKHGLASRIRDWRWSTFHQFVELGEYALDWGSADPTPGWVEPEWE